MIKEKTDKPKNKKPPEAHLQWSSMTNDHLLGNSIYSFQVRHELIIQYSYRGTGRMPDELAFSCRRYQSLLKSNTRILHTDIQTAVLVRSNLMPLQYITTSWTTLISIELTANSHWGQMSIIKKNKNNCKTPQHGIHISHQQSSSS